MKRDMDLIRELLLRLEAYPAGAGDIFHITPDSSEIQVEGFDFDQIDYHLQLIIEVGWVNTGGTSAPMVGVFYSGLTWAGHDFLDSIRGQDIWDKTKKGALDAGGFTVDLLKDLAKGFIKKQIEERTGVKI